MIIAISTQNAEQWKDYRSKEVAVYLRSNEFDHSMEGMTKLIEEKAIRKKLVEIILMNGQADLSLHRDHKHVYIQPSCNLNQPRGVLEIMNITLPHHFSQRNHNTSWRSDGSPSCLGGSSHGWVPVNTHSTPVPTSVGRLWVAHQQHTSVKCQEGLSVLQHVHLKNRWKPPTCCPPNFIHTFWNTSRKEDTYDSLKTFAFTIAFTCNRFYLCGLPGHPSYLISNFEL